MSNVVFEDNSIYVKDVIEDKIKSFLHEVGGEIKAQAQRNSRRKTSQTAGSYHYRTDMANHAVHIGSDYINAIYEEFGTGEHALHGDGRKGYWVYVDTGGEPKAPKGGKSYTLAEAKRVVRFLRLKGLDAHYTKGKTANRPLYNAFTQNEAKIKAQAERYFKSI